MTCQLCGQSNHDGPCYGFMKDKIYSVGLSAGKSQAADWAIKMALNQSDADRLIETCEKLIEIAEEYMGEERHYQREDRATIAKAKEILAGIKAQG